MKPTETVLKKISGPVTRGAVLTMALCATSGSLSVQSNYAVTGTSKYALKMIYDSLNEQSVFVNPSLQTVYSTSNIGYRFNNDTIANLQKIDQIGRLEAGWNGEHAKAFSKQLLNLARNIIVGIHIQPEIFPTAADSIQMEFGKTNGEYLELQICENDTIEVFEIDENKEEKEYKIKNSLDSINRVVDDFYG